jgi:hypothetical protein
MVIKINKPTDKKELRVLFPWLQISSGGSPVFGRAVFVSDESDVVGDCGLVLVQSGGGYNVDTHLGLCGFLREVDYFGGSAGKMSRFEKLGSDEVKDGFGRVIVPAGCFNGFVQFSVVDMYRWCSVVRMCNRFSGNELGGAGGNIGAAGLVQMLQGDLYHRLRLSAGNGFNVLSGVLGLVGGYYGGGFRGGRVLFEEMGMVLSRFDGDGFGGFRLSGDVEEDCGVLMSLFGV